MGDLIRAPHSEINAFIEGLDALGVTPHDLKVFRSAKPDAQSRRAIAKVLMTDPMAWAALQFGSTLEELGIMPAHLDAARQNSKRMLALKEVLLGHADIKQIEHLVDSDAAPFTPTGTVVESSPRQGEV